MKRLILMRHAKTEPWAEGIDDHGRALTARGHEDARKLAEHLQAVTWVPDRILVSTARRARETCAEVMDIFEGERVRPMESLYLTNVRGLTEIVRANDDVHTLMLIGHNPGMHEFALSILREAGSAAHHAGRRLYEKFPTNCTALFEADEDSNFLPVFFPLIEVIRAKDFRGG